MRMAVPPREPRDISDIFRIHEGESQHMTLEEHTLLRTAMLR